MRKVKILALIVGLAALAAVAVACGRSSEEGETATEPAAPVVSSGAPAVRTGDPAPAAVGAPGVAGLPLVQAASSQTGIWVTGTHTITLEPDLALLNIGVEGFANTVAEARDEAATAMEAITKALKARGVQDKDIQTRFFNISPRYEYGEVIEEGLRRSKQTLVGYQVNNSAAVKIRDLDAVGVIIDEVADAGGDATRFQGISFTVEDTKPFMAELRTAAVQDALDKAQQFASLTGVSLGRLVFISESGAGVPIVRPSVERAFAVAAAAPAPPSAISGGELELRMTVQAVFDIQ